MLRPVNTDDINEWARAKLAELLRKLYRLAEQGFLLPDDPKSGSDR